MRLIFILLVFLPALIHGRPMDEDEPSKPSNSNEDEILGLKDCVDGTAEGTMKGCSIGSKCNSCWCKSKDTGKKIGFKCD